MNFETLYYEDKDIYDAIYAEIERQDNNIELIASENIVSLPVLQALGSPLTNKYAEGYPGRRYYAGCEFVDRVENLCINRAKKIFNCTYANVQPHSGAQANLSVFFSLLSPGDTFMALDLNSGAHLSHGSPVNISGKWFNMVPYTLDSEGYINYDRCLEIAKKVRPKLIIAGASAYPRAINFKIMREIADSVGAYLMADIAHIAGLVVTKLHMSPIPYAHVTTTTTHKTLRGPRGGLILSSEEFAKEMKLNKGIFPGTQGGPHMHTIAAKAVALKEADSQEYYKYMVNVINNSFRLAEELKRRNIDLVTKGTDNHLILISLFNKDISGKELETRLAEGNVTVNKNLIPFDPRTPAYTSGIRIGTPAITTRGMDEEDMPFIAEAIKLGIESPYNARKIAEIAEYLTKRYPLSKIYNR